MVQVRLPDGSVRDFRDGVCAREIAEAIGPRLAKDAVAARKGDQVIDLDQPIADGAVDLRILTPKDPEALDVMRHSAAHVMARAVMRLFPGVQLAFGPTVANGFYYDLELPQTISEDDLPRIEGEMRKIVQDGEPFERFSLPTAEARQLCEGLGQKLKVEHIDDELKQFPTLSFYRQGEFIDLCRGPHVPHAGKIAAFKLRSVAGAYWKNDASRPMLQRLYGTAWFSQKDLDEYLQRIEEAKKRDHRVLGRQLGLFTISPLVGPGLVLWMPKGAVVRGMLENFIKEELVRRGYQPVYTPHVAKVQLYELSGHYPFYADKQFPPLEMEGEKYLLKPMNCPHHIQIYKAQPRSYRELPVRLAEFGTVYRYEQSGELGGLTRVRGFTQDDAHLFCTAEQVEDEFRSTLEMVLYVFQCLGLSDYRVRIGLRDPQSQKYTGSDENWNRAEAAIRRVVKDVRLRSVEEPGEAAFYGPKVDFVVRDCIGREWQLGTVQLDYNLPERFELEYIGADNRPHRPVMIHRAPLGSFERFMGILIEHFSGAFPAWLAPVQARVLPISDKYEAYARGVEQRLSAAGLRVDVDLRAEKIGAKIRDAQLEKIPYMLIVGEKEQSAGTVAVRDRVEGDQGAISLEAFVTKLTEEVRQRTVRQPASLGIPDDGEAETGGPEVPRHTY